MKNYYRIIEFDPPSLETIDVLINDYEAVHLYTSVNNLYRHFLARLSEDDIIILRLKYSHMSFDQLSYRELGIYKEDGYIR